VANPSPVTKFTSVTGKAAQRLSGRQKRAQLKLQHKLADFGLTESALNSLSSVAIELIRTANSNPAMGMFTAIVTSDILYRIHVISWQAMLAVWASVGALEVASIANIVEGDTASLLKSITSIFNIGGAAVQTDPIAPVTATLVYPGNGTNITSPADIQALMSLLSQSKAK
jgi:hypothetical protein